jgi:hypothetical protein
MQTVRSKDGTAIAYEVAGSVAGFVPATVG